MKFFDIIDKIPYPALILAAILMGLAPFYPMPHLYEKLLMLKKGLLRKPIDIFDLFFHSAPILILILKIIRDSLKR